MSFEPWIPPVLPVRGGGGFPTRRVFCVGRNYAAHAREMGSDPQREPPCFFMKPTDSLQVGDGVIAYPKATAELHHEVELVVAVAKRLDRCSVEQARAAVFGYAVGLDLTRRDLQREAKEKRWPWALSKGFEQAAPVSELVRGVDPKGQIWLDVNGERRQQASLTDLIWPVPEVLVTLSTLVTLQPGDLVFTGTPAGVGPLLRGDELQAHVDDVGDLKLRIV